MEFQAIKIQWSRFAFNICEPWIIDEEKTYSGCFKSGMVVTLPIDTLTQPNYSKVMGQCNKSIKYAVCI